MNTMNKTDKYFWEVQTTWHIQDNTSANYFLILCKSNNLQFELTHEDCFYRIDVEGNTDNLIKLKKDWDFRKSVIDPINPAAYLIATEDANRKIDSYETIIMPHKSTNIKFKIDKEVPRPNSVSYGQLNEFSDTKVPYNEVLYIKRRRTTRRRQCFKCGCKFEKGKLYIEHRFRYDYRLMSISICDKCN